MPKWHLVLLHFAPIFLLLNTSNLCKMFCVNYVLSVHADAARRHFSLVLLKKSFDIWITRWQRQVELSQFDDLISYKGDVATARRVFVNWKYCILAL